MESTPRVAQVRVPDVLGDLISSLFRMLDCLVSELYELCYHDLVSVMNQDAVTVHYPVRLR